MFKLLFPELRFRRLFKIFFGHTWLKLIPSRHTGTGLNTNEEQAQYLVKKFNFYLGRYSPSSLWRSFFKGHEAYQARKQLINFVDAETVNIASAQSHSGVDSIHGSYSFIERWYVESLLIPPITYALTLGFIWGPLLEACAYVYISTQERVRDNQDLNFLGFFLKMHFESFENLAPRLLMALNPFALIYYALLSIEQLLRWFFYATHLRHVCTYILSPLFALVSLPIVMGMTLLNTLYEGILHFMIMPLIFFISSLFPGGKFRNELIVELTEHEIENEIYRQRSKDDQPPAHTLSPPDQKLYDVSAPPRWIENDRLLPRRDDRLDAKDTSLNSTETRLKRKFIGKYEGIIQQEKIHYVKVIERSYSYQYPTLFVVKPSADLNIKTRLLEIVRQRETAEQAPTQQEFTSS